MSKNLVIVESPAKAKTIEGYLGSDFKVKSSIGHIRDLPKKGMSVDIEHGFKPTYEISEGKQKVVSELKKAVKTSKTVWLATDEDREGEAIAWHLSEVLDLPAKTTKRIVFHEITKPAIEKAIENPRTIDKKLVDAQQARRVLDRVVGYELSPVLWKKVRPGLSAGRVQSVAVRLIVERESEIQEHKPETHFKVTAIFTSGKQEIAAECPTKFKTEDQAHKYLEKLAASDFTVTAVEQKPSKRNPSPPFTTSTLQQVAGSRLGWSPKTTMSVAQKLYETGLITYMRTDSLNLSPVAIKSMGDYIKSEYGDNYYESRQFATKSSTAQEAHEAIRPTHPKKATAGADDSQKRLYGLIWRRALSSQMAAARTEKTTLTIQPSKAEEALEAKGEVLEFDGYLKVWGRTGEDKILPDLTTGDKLKLDSGQAEQTFSRPPARFTEASLVKALEDMGIGRPSTYAPTISTIQAREYVEKKDVAQPVRTVVVLELDGKKVKKTESEITPPEDSNKLVPTSTGEVVTDFLVKYFREVIDYDFTAKLEGQFDEVAKGEIHWQKVLEDFYGPFSKTVKGSEKVSKAEANQARELGKDPKSGKPVFARFGRYGPMLQIGTKDDEEKPQFAPMPEGAKIETVTLKEALEMFKLPRIVGATADGQEIRANIGRFGPYIQVDKTFVSIKEPLDPMTIDETEARKLYNAKLRQEAKKHIKEFDSGLKVLNGRYGPYVTDGKKNASVPKETDPEKLTEAQAQKLLDDKPAGKGWPRKRAVK